MQLHEILTNNHFFLDTYEIKQRISNAKSLMHDGEITASEYKEMRVEILGRDSIEYECDYGEAKRLRFLEACVDWRVRISNHFVENSHNFRILQYPYSVLFLTQLMSALVP